MHDYLLAHDLGTSGDKAVLFNAVTLEIVSSVVYPYETYYEEHGGVEHDSEAWWKAVCASTQELLAATGVKAEQIGAVSFSAIMNSCLPVTADGAPLRRALIWCDQRSEEELKEIREFASDDDFYHKTGHKLNATYAVAKMLWYKNNQPSLYEKTAYFLQAKDYIVYKLTGKFATDYSDMSHLGVMDQRKKALWPELMKQIGIPQSMFPEVHKSTDVIGWISEKAAREVGLLAGTPVVMGGGDGCCASAGAGIYQPGHAYNILGTSSWNATLTDDMMMSPKKETMSFIHLDGQHFTALGTMQSAGHSLNWLLKLMQPNFYAQDKDVLYPWLNKTIERMIAQSKMRNIIYLPYLLGERSPWWNSNARGCFIGMDASTEQSDLALACLEGVAYNLKVILDDIEDNLGELGMRVIGGGVRNEQWIRILASVWNKQLQIPKYCVEATSLGAIMCAGIGTGLFKDFSAIEQINPVRQCINPEPALVQRYAKLYPVFKQAYYSLVETFDSLSALN